MGGPGSDGPKKSAVNWVCWRKTLRTSSVVASTCLRKFGAQEQRAAIMAECEPAHRFQRQGSKVGAAGRSPPTLWCAAVGGRHSAGSAALSIALAALLVTASVINHTVAAAAPAGLNSRGRVMQQGAGGRGSGSSSSGGGDTRPGRYSRDSGMEFYAFADRGEGVPTPQPAPHAFADCASRAGFTN